MCCWGVWRWGWGEFLGNPPPAIILPGRMEGDEVITPNATRHPIPHLPPYLSFPTMKTSTAAECDGTQICFRYQFRYFFRNQNFPVTVPTPMENSRENSDTGNKYPGILLWNSIFLHPYFWPHLTIDLFVKANPKDLPLTGNWMLRSDILDTWWRGGRHGETLNFYTSARLSFVNKW